MAKGVVCRVRGHAELVLLRQPPQLLKQLDLEDVTQDLDREQVAAFGEEAVLAEPAAGDEAMYMGMVLEFLGPGVEHGQDAWTQTAPGRYLEDGLGRRGEESLESVDPPLSREERAERGGDREAHAGVAARGQGVWPGPRPTGLVETASPWATSG